MKKLQHHQPLPVLLVRTDSDGGLEFIYEWVLAEGCPYCGKLHGFVPRQRQDPREALTERVWMQCREEDEEEVETREARRKGDPTEETMGFSIYDADPQGTERVLREDAGRTPSPVFRSPVWLDVVSPDGYSLNFVWRLKPCDLCGGDHHCYACPASGDPTEFLRQLQARPDCRPGRNGVVFRIFHDIDRQRTERIMRKVSALAAKGAA